jgi:hypothetical protein
MALSDFFGHLWTLLSDEMVLYGRNHAVFVPVSIPISTTFLAVSRSR